MLHIPRARSSQVLSAHAAFNDNDDDDELYERERVRVRRRFVPQSKWTDLDLEADAWAYGRHRLLGSVCATIGDGGVGKSALVIAESIAMATGRNLLGVEPEGRQRVLYWNGEDRIEVIQKRVIAACQHYGVGPDMLAGWFFAMSGHDAPIKIATAGRDGITFDDGVVEDLSDTMREHETDVLIIDPFVACHSVPENDNTAIQAVVLAWSKLAASKVACVEFVHHTRKPAHGGPAEVAVADARGASALIDAVRSARVLNRMTEAEGAQARVENYKCYFRADNGKANYSPPSDAATWFKTVSVPLLDADGGPLDKFGTVAVTPWRFPGALDDVTPDHMMKVRTMAADGTYRSDQQSPDWIGCAVADVLALDVEDDRARIKKVLKVWFANGVLRAVERKDDKRMVRSFVEPGNWSPP